MHVHSRVTNHTGVKIPDCSSHILEAHESRECHGHAIVAIPLYSQSESVHEHFGGWLSLVLSPHHSDDVILAVFPRGNPLRQLGQLSTICLQLPR